MTTDSAAVDVSEDWAIACQVQERYIEVPCAKTQVLTYSARCRQMLALGGDCFDFQSLPGGRVTLAVADASGKELPAALIMPNVQSSLRTAALFAPDDVSAVVTSVNRQSHASSARNRFATLLFGVSTRMRGRCNMRMQATIHRWLSSGGDSIAWREAGAPPVGLFSDTVYKAQAVQLNLADLIVAYADGMVDAANTAGEEWGVRGLLASVAACEMRQPERIVQTRVRCARRVFGRQTKRTTQRFSPPWLTDGGRECGARR